MGIGLRGHATDDPIIRPCRYKCLGRLALLGPAVGPIRGPDASAASCNGHADGAGSALEDGETGFLFSDLSSEGLFGACRRAFDAFDDSNVLAEMRQAAMALSFHWSGAAAEYEQLYSRLIGRRLAGAEPAPTRRRSRPAVAELPAAA